MWKGRAEGAGTKSRQKKRWRAPAIAASGQTKETDGNKGQDEGQADKRRR